MSGIWKHIYHWAFDLSIYVNEKSFWNFVEENISISIRYVHCAWFLAHWQPSRQCLSVGETTLCMSGSGYIIIFIIWWLRELYFLSLRRKIGLSIISLQKPSSFTALNQVRYQISAICTRILNKWNHTNTFQYTNIILYLTI